MDVYTYLYGKAIIIITLIQKRTEHMVRKKDERIPPKRSETKKQEGCRKRGRPQRIWDV